MPYPRPHNLLVIQGTLSNGQVQEEWQTGLRIGRTDGAPGAPNGAAMTAILAAIDADLRTWWGSIGSTMAPTTYLRGFKFNAVDEDGRYVSTTQTLGGAFGASGLQGSAGTQALPAQLSIVASLETTAGRGLASAGRLFLPGCASGGLTAEGTLFGQYRDTLQTATATLLTNLNNWPGLDAAADPGVVVVASKVREGAMRRVTGVSVGNRFDVQRSRAGKIPERRSPVSPVT